jgi:hypothetical protein
VTAHRPRRSAHPRPPSHPLAPARTDWQLTARRPRPSTHARRAHCLAPVASVRPRPPTASDAQPQAHPSGPGLRRLGSRPMTAGHRNAQPHMSQPSHAWPEPPADLSGTTRPRRSARAQAPGHRHPQLVPQPAATDRRQRCSTATPKPTHSPPRTAASARREPPRPPASDPSAATAVSAPSHQPHQPRQYRNRRLATLSSQIRALFAPPDLPAEW